MIDQIFNFIKKLIPQKLFKKIQPIYHLILAKLSAFIYGYPSEKMIVVGVTGTAGKSSTCYFIAQILEQAGFKVGLTSTTIFKIADKEWLNDRKMTMLGRFQTQKFLKEMLMAGCQVAIIETSSQGIEQYRHIGINYDILVFTNLYPEHIEAHGGFENYKKAKGKLFEYLLKCRDKRYKVGDKNNIKKTIIVNLDDEQAEYFLSFKAEQKLGYGLNIEDRIKNIGLKDVFFATGIRKENYGLSANILYSTFQIPLLGQYNIYNVLAAVSVAKAFNIPEEKIKQAVGCLKPLPGRLEFIKNKRELNIIVDYAFEPKALDKLYQVVKDMPHQKIIHVLGSTGGGRDKARRPILGAMAAANADVVIVTNEDPYDENPQAIINEVARGAEMSDGKCQILTIVDRREAIKKALALAQTGDLVLLTGKGAEQAMCVAGGKKIPWDDRRIVLEELGGIDKKS